jgi:hypothetical protein
MSFKTYFESIEIEAFHGTPHEIQKFSDDFVGEGVDQEGPGIYFTTSEEDAYGYARKSEGHGKVYKVRLSLNKLIKEKGKVKTSEIDSLIEWAPNFEEKLMDWGHEDLPSNLKEFKASLNREQSVKGPKGVFLSIWYDLYRYAPQEYVRNMVLLGYDGLIVQKDFLSAKHIIVYNPKSIKVLDIY